MSTLNTVMVKQAARKLKGAINKFCRARVNAGLCEPDDCEFCPCLKAYEMTEATEAEDEYDE